MGDEERLQRRISIDFEEQGENVRVEESTVYTCPDCGGVLWQSDGPGTWFRCHVGHAYAPEVLLGQKSEEVEAALWSCVRLLRERATLTRQTAVRYHQGGSRELAERAEEQAQSDERQADVLRNLIEAMPSLADLPLLASSGGPAESS